MIILLNRWWLCEEWFVLMQRSSSIWNWPGESSDATFIDAHMNWGDQLRCDRKDVGKKKEPLARLQKDGIFTCRSSKTMPREAARKPEKGKDTIWRIAPQSLESEKTTRSWWCCSRRLPSLELSRRVFPPRTQLMQPNADSSRPNPSSCPPPGSYPASSLVSAASRSWCPATERPPPRMVPWETEGSSAPPRRRRKLVAPRPSLPDPYRIAFSLEDLCACSSTAEKGGSL